MRLLSTLCCLTLLTVGLVHAQAPTAKPAQPIKPTPVVMEYYYKIKWGKQDEFLRLYKKNHLPFLKELMKTGEIVSVKTEKPAEHGTEDGRWDYRVTIIFRDLEAAFGDKSGDEEMFKRLFPDQATFEREEQQRFELLLAHWDVRIETVKVE